MFALDLPKDLNSTDRMLIEAAQKHGVKIKRVNKKYVVMGLGRSVYKVRITAMPASFNAKKAVQFAKDKAATIKVLRERGLPTPQNRLFSPDELEDAWNWAQPLLPIVLKPNSGKWGTLVFVNVNSYDEFAKAFSEIGAEYQDILVEQFVQGDEYRFTCIKGRVVAIVHRCPANIIGDGKQTIEQLVRQKNKAKAAKNLNAQKWLMLDAESTRILDTQGYNVQSVPPEGERVYLRRNSNISTGGDSIDVTDTMDQEIVQMVSKASSVISGLDICGIDVLIDEDKRANIIEINGTPGFNVHRYPWEGQPRDVAAMLVEAMFPSQNSKSIGGWLRYESLVTYFRVRFLGKKMLVHLFNKKDQANS